MFPTATEFDLNHLLTNDIWPEDQCIPPACLTQDSAKKLIERIDTVPIFAHTYPFYFNFHFETMHPQDVMDFAYINGLSGCSLYVYDGGPLSLAAMTKKEREAFGAYAVSLGLTVFLETSDTDKNAIDEVVAVARDVGAKTIRAYSRYEGKFSSVLEQIRRDLAYMGEIAERFDLNFDFEQHEDLKAIEIADLLRENGSKRCNAVFDFTNMISAYETPINAMRDMAPYIRQVHVKGGKRVYEPRGWAQEVVVFGTEEDQIPAIRLFYELLMLGDTKQQVIAFILQQEAGYYAPPFRSPKDTIDPFIPYRSPSETPLPDGISREQLALNERCYAQDMIRQVRKILGRLRTATMLWLNSEKHELRDTSINTA